MKRIYSTFGDRAFGAAGPGLWNSLPSHLKDADISYSEFRRSLKTFLFGQWGHSAVWTVLIAPTRNILTYLLTYSHLTPLIGVTPFEFRDEYDKTRTRVSGLSICEVIAMIALFLLIQTWLRQTDGRRNGHPDRSNTPLASLDILSRR